MAPCRARRHHLRCLVAGALLAVASPALALDDREEPTLQQLRSVHAAADGSGNADGLLSLQELLEHARQILQRLAVAELPVFKAAMDSDKDGRLSLAEHLEQFSGEPDDAWEAEDPGQRAKTLETERARFAAADVSGDGQLDDSELPQFLYPELGPGGVTDVNVRETMESFDANGDGFLSAQEVADDGDEPDTLAMDFAGLDVDGDGRLSEAEVRPWQTRLYHARLRLGQFFELADRDSDGALSLDELLASRVELVQGEAYAHFVPLVSGMDPAGVEREEL